MHFRCLVQIAAQEMHLVQIHLRNTSTICTKDAQLHLVRHIQAEKLFCLRLQTKELVFLYSQALQVTNLLAPHKGT